MDKEKDEFSLPQSVEVDEIIEFYKDKDDAESASEEVNKSQEEKKKHSLINNIPFFRDKLNKSTADDDIQSQIYGLSEKGRVVLYRVTSAVICAVIIAVSFVLAYYLPGNEEKVEKYKADFREQDEYKDIKSTYDSLTNEINDLKTSNEDKKKQIEQIDDIDNTKADLRAKITDKSYELNGLNAQIAQKRSEIEELDKSISEKSAPETVYSPGKYTAGKNIPIGKYSVTGTGKFMVASSSGISKLNTTLGSTPIEITLSQNDVVKFESKVKFTPIN